MLWREFLSLSRIHAPGTTQKVRFSSHLIPVYGLYMVNEAYFGGQRNILQFFLTQGTDDDVLQQSSGFFSARKQHHNTRSYSNTAGIHRPTYIFLFFLI